MLVDSALPRAIHAVGISFPALLQRVTHRRWVRYNGVLQDRLTVNTNDAEVIRSVCRVSAKLALAAFYEHHGRSATCSVKINTMWSHNQSQGVAKSVDKVLGMLRHTSFLKLGKHDTQKSFYFRYYAEGHKFMCASVLHESLALLAEIVPEDDNDNWMPWHHVWAPISGKGIQPFRTRPSLILLP